MDLQLTGKRALVTGSNSGLGESIAERLAAEGAEVVVHGRDHARAETVAARIGGTVAVGDLATDEGADAVATAALAGGGIDILVNNAGAYEHLTWAEASPDHWRQTYEVNVVSGVRMIHRFVPAMRERGWGRVITIGGGLATQPMAGLPHYNATLAARHNLAVSLARELRDTGVTSNVVAPGAILVPAVQEFLTGLAPDRGWGRTWAEVEHAAVRELVPNDVGRFGRPEEIAGAVAYLTSTLADYVSGAVLRVDGGTIRSVA
ncbi:NAD(P)-dependent dehydrogenase (short-subunit alcohol dehydrogenase family) [Crossiella equi]|uniref:NAD(P)-dependent dehydrogenase (Short-subunit alcohol dehydrogenase family) n=1 Tax=Crossiella equi TaxID=130796 RepID=A0ABS5A3S6_9PSEU|nr:SDR family NAD(P)-dependent oxidoreductase [Crossiella equi]MBP2471233.1 NAD(P)-dependent dehydrogenase (short-subunit alcohol dehydrogenase family) [Crossiella equi]